MPDTVANKETRLAIGEMWADGWTAPEIAVAYGVSKQAIHQKLGLLKRDGALPPRRYVCFSEIVSQLGSNWPTLAPLAAKLGIAPERRGEHRLVYPLGVVDQLRQVLIRHCVLCGAPVTMAGNRRYCKRGDCKAEAIRDIRRRCVTQLPTASSVAANRLPSMALKAIQGVAPGDVFVSLKEARQVSGLSETQLGWLRKRRIIAVCPHPRNKPGARKPHHLYSLAHVQAIKEVLAS